MPMPEELDPKKFHILTPKKQKILALIIFALFFIIGPILGSFYYKFAINRPSQITKEITLEIKSGESLDEIAGKLYSQGLLNSEILFKIYVIANKLDNKIQAGVYTIPAGTTVVQLTDILQHGTNDLAITFLEGWRVEEFALKANTNLNDVDYENFVALAGPSEGYLFPDTYYLNINISEKELLDVLRNNFEEKTRDVLTDEALQNVGLTKEQAVIFASIVEREVAKEDDRPIVAGILIKRWKNGELIGADATTQYAVAKIKVGCELNSRHICPSDDDAQQVQWWPKNLTIDDLNMDSPYNTRKVSGLPPTPISNPGISALKAVLNPVFTDYNYYLTDSEGITHYARTLEEHTANISNYL